MILALKTADETTELYLFNIASAELAIKNQKKWQPGRELAQTLLSEIEQLLQGDSLQDLTGLIVYAGPGSFTGLRIGISTMNTLAYSLNIPIVGVTGDTWLEDGFKRLLLDENDKIVIPEYGAAANITMPKR